MIGTALSLPVEARAGGRPRAVVTFTILKDLAASLAAERWEIATLVGPDADIHSYQSTPADARRLAHADLLISNGLGLETWLPRLVAATSFKARHVVASEGITPLMRDADHAGSAPSVDPHCWQDVGLVRRYVVAIGDGLAALDPDGALQYRRRQGELDRKLAALDAWIREQIDRVPPDKRRVITSHDAFGYFAHAYGVELIPARSLNANRDPTPREIAQLIDLVRRHEARALFIENFGSPALIRQIAHDAGGVVGGTLYSDSLSAAGGPASTYEAMMRHNATALVEGMLRN